MTSWGAVLAFAIGLVTFAAGVDAASFDGKYEVRVGDLNADGRNDIYISYKPSLAMVPFDDLLIPVPISRRDVGEFVLQQNSDGAFSVRDNLSTPDLRIVRQWPKSVTILPVLADLNFDRQKDLYLRNIASVASGADDLLVYAPTASGASPSALRPIDGGVRKFVRDINGWDQNRQHYFDPAWLPVFSTVPWLVNVYNCGGPVLEHYWAGSIGDAWASLECEYLSSYIVGRVVQTGWQFDSVNYSVTALRVSERVGKYPTSGTITMSAADAAGVVLDVQALFGVPLGLLPPSTNVVIETAADTATQAAKSGSWGGVLRWLGVATRLTSIIGGVLTWTETADDTLFSMYFHNTYTDFATSILASAIRAPAYVTQGPIVPGSVAQQLWGLPPKDALDTPPDVYLTVTVPRPATILIEDNGIHGPANLYNSAAGQWVYRTGGGREFVSRTAPIPGSMLSGPFPLPPSP